MLYTSILTVSVNDIITRLTGFEKTLLKKYQKRVLTKLYILVILYISGYTQYVRRSSS